MFYKRLLKASYSIFQLTQCEETNHFKFKHLRDMKQKSLSSQANHELVDPLITTTKIPFC